MNKALVSVAIPVYNGMPNIKMAIESLKEQTYSLWEAIIVDDGSTDGTAEYIDSLKDGRFIIHHFSRNLGRPFARQKALELASGEYLAMLDADDFYAPNKLETQIIAMVNNPNVVLVGAGMCSWGSNTTEIRIRDCGDGKIKIATQKSMVSHASSMIRMDEAKKVKYNTYLQYGEDQDFLRQIMKNKPYLVLPDVLYYYSEFDSVNKSKIITSHKVCLKNYLRKHEYSAAAKELSKYIICFLVYCFISNQTIVSWRGVSATEEQRCTFKKNYNLLTKAI